MLFILIPIAWLTVTVLMLCICAMAARGDSQPQPLLDASPDGFDRLEAWDGPAPVAHDRRSHHGSRWRPATRGIS
jgi:hypothetical protein